MFDITKKLHELKVFEDMSLPRLISYPRTGSHWFRILMESYLLEPSAVQSFLHRPEDVNSIWGFHIHHRLIDNPHYSEGPVVGLQNAIYLYRNPADTIFSQMKYHNEILSEWDGKPTGKIENAMKKFKDEYYNHLDFYLNNKSKITNIHYVRYEDLQSNPFKTFENCVKFLGKEWNQNKFHQIYLRCDKNLTKKLTPHDNLAVSVDEINRQQMMANHRKAFRNLYGNEIAETFKDLT